jgi:hypothetical protein
MAANVSASAVTSGWPTTQPLKPAGVRSQVRRQTPPSPERLFGRFLEVFVLATVRAGYSAGVGKNVKAAFVWTSGD